MHNYTVTLNHIIQEANQKGNYLVESYALQLDHLLHEEKVSPRFIEMTLEFLEGMVEPSEYYMMD